MQSQHQIATNRGAERAEQPPETGNRNCQKRPFRTVLVVQLASVPVAVAIGLLSDGLHLAISVGYGALIMLIVNLLLARSMHMWSQHQQGDKRKSNAITTAAGRFALVAALLVAASFAGLWLPGVAGGMLIAQIAVYLAGFWLLVGSEIKTEIKGETL